MKVLDRITREKFSWFDLVFVLITFTLARDELTGAFQSLALVAIAFVVATERVWLRNWINSKLRPAGSAARESAR